MARKNLPEFEIYQSTPQLLRLFLYLIYSPDAVRFGITKRSEDLGSN